MHSEFLSHRVWPEYHCSFILRERMRKKRKKIFAYPMAAASHSRPFEICWKSAMSTSKDGPRALYYLFVFCYLGVEWDDGSSSFNASRLNLYWAYLKLTQAPYTLLHLIETSHYGLRRASPPHFLASSPAVQRVQSYPYTHVAGKISFRIVTFVLVNKNFPERTQTNDHCGK